MRGFDLRGHAGLITYAVGSLIITLWTLLRFATQRTIFDLVGQQVLAQQILAGHGAGASVGITNYIFKMFFLYIPMDALPGEPRLKLIILTVLVNVVSYILIGVLVGKILREFNIRPGVAYYAAVLWLSLVAGSVFWIEFTNSRNLEVAGGLLLVLLSVRFLRHATRTLWAGIAAFAAVLFFADNLQLYMTAVPLVLFAGVLAVQARKGYARAALLAGAMVVGFLVSKGLFALTIAVLHISFVDASTAIHLTAASFAKGVAGTAVAFGRLLLGGADAGRVREAVNAVLLTVLLGTAAWGVLRRRMPVKLGLLIGSILAVNMAVFALSSFPGQREAERYLIMSAPVLMIAISAIRPTGIRFSRTLAATVAIGVLVNVVALGHTFVHAWPTQFAADAHTMTVVRFTDAAAVGRRVYASMDASIPGAYLVGSYRNAPLPLSCLDGTLRKTTFFYAKDAYSEREAQPTQTVTIVLDGTAITNAPNSCTLQTIEHQLGAPAHSGTLTDGSIYLDYSPEAARRLTY